MTDIYAAFDGPRLLARGTAPEVALAVKRAVGADGPVLVFDEHTGAEIDFDLSGTEADVLARLEVPSRGRGRPKLGVVAREVTLLQRHWDWLGGQRGGASAALRRLVDEARKIDDGATERRRAEAATYKVLSALAGDRPGFEEAARALFAGDEAAFLGRIADWPGDIAAQARRMLAQTTDAQRAR